MHRLAATIDMRKHPRAQLEMPARLRWRGPLGMRLEAAKTVDVGREGLLIETTERCESGAHVWVAYPFDADAKTAQPETPARVLRAEKRPSHGFRVALHFEESPRAGVVPGGRERRGFPRVSFALPVSLRAFGLPWPEESMTQDVSRGGVRMTTVRNFAVGDDVYAKIAWGDWTRSAEIPGRVVRVESLEDALNPSPVRPITCIAIQWKRVPKR
ncbi:MAG: PilZ domain-containing protein [Candidatus Acidiferrales bacterium]